MKTSPTGKPQSETGSLNLDTMASIALSFSRIARQEVLSRAETRELFKYILSNDTRAADFYWGAVFGALQTRGLNDGELLGFVDAIMEFDHILKRNVEEKIDLGIDAPVIAITGSGKEGFKTFNVSTCAALIAAACGVHVVKPCSRSTSAVSGSTDVLEELGIHFPTDPLELTRLARETKVCFLNFSQAAPIYAGRYDGLLHHFHPLSYVVPPLCIPVKLDGIVYGISDVNVEFSARLLKEIGYRSASVVCGEVAAGVYVDEFIQFGKSRIATLNEDGITTSEISGHLLDKSDLEALRQATSHFSNAQMVEQVLRGSAPALAVNLACLNAALVIQLARKSLDLSAAVALAHQAVESGAAIEKLLECRDRYSQIRDMR